MALLGAQKSRCPQSVIVGADMPVTGRVVTASRQEPYIAVAVEIDMAVFRELALQTGPAVDPPPAAARRSLFVDDTDAAALDCATRLVRLLDRPDAAPVLRPGIMRELHYWLLSGRHGDALRALALPDSHASRLAEAIRIVRAEHQAPIRVERLAAAAGMSPTAFHRHFKAMTSLTPGQFQKHLRLVEARRLMLDEGYGASRAAFAVGYESVSHFTREYRRMFGSPPKRDVLRLARPGVAAAHNGAELGG